MDLENTTYGEIEKHISENQDTLEEHSSYAHCKYVYDKKLDCTIRIVNNESFTVYKDRIDKVNNHDYYPSRFKNCVRYSKDGLINKQELIWNTF